MEMHILCTTLCICALGLDYHQHYGIKSISVMQASCGGFSNDLSHNCVHKVAWAMWWRVDLFRNVRCDVDDIS